MCLCRKSCGRAKRVLAVLDNDTKPHVPLRGVKLLLGRPNEHINRKTLASNMESHYDRIPYEKLPKSVQDAITAPRRLRSRYLSCGWTSYAPVLPSMLHSNFLNSETEYAMTGSTSYFGGRELSTLSFAR